MRVVATVANDRTGSWSPAGAAVAASVLMLVLGVVYHVLAARLEVPSDRIPISSAALSRFPMDIGDWTGADVSLDERLVRATQADAILNRRYTRRHGLEMVSFYLASGVRARDLMPHRPEVCYTGAGWTLTERRPVQLPLRNAGKLHCNILQFSRGALTTETVLVLNYYLVDGQCCADVSLLRSKAWRGSGKVRYVAQVQVAASATALLDGAAAVKAVSDFAVESAALTMALFDNCSPDQNQSEVHELSGGHEHGA